MFALIKNRSISKSHIDRFMAMSHTKYELQQSELCEENVLNALLSLAEQSGWDIRTMLFGLEQAVPEKGFRNWCRSFLISVMYNILPRYQRGGTKEYSIIYASDDCVFVHSPRIIRSNELIKPSSTIVLTPQGDIKTPEGRVWIDKASITWHGFTAKWNNLLGIYSRKGDVFLPCVFDDVENSAYLPCGELYYKGFLWKYYQKGRFDQLKKDDILLWANGEDHYHIFSYGDNLFDLKILGPKIGSSTMALPIEKIDMLKEENKKELLDIIGAIHHKYTPKELLQLAEHAKVE